MRHTKIINSEPNRIPNDHLPDGAITGNGDLSLMWGGSPQKLKLYIGKADFWRAEQGDRAQNGICPVGIIEIRNPMVTYSDYYVEQRMDDGEMVGKFSGAGCGVEISTVCCAVENAILIEISSTWPGVSISCELEEIAGIADVSSVEKNCHMNVLKRGFDNEVMDFSTYGVAALKKVSQKTGEGKIRIRYAVTVTTNHDCVNYENDAISRLECIDDERFEDLKCRHCYWWQNFWSKSKVELPDYPDVELFWYASLYVMACCARNKKFPPGLWGNFATKDGMAWGGDYHLNYNFSAPFYGLVSANHVELTDCYSAPLMDYLPIAMKNAREYLGCGGVYFPVGIGPLGLDTSCYEHSMEHRKLFLGQKSNAAYSGVIMAMRWYGTRDKQYAFDVAYPYMKAVMCFWEDYLVLDNGRYVVVNDAIHEVEYYSFEEFLPKRHDDFNPIITLGMLRMTLHCLLDMQSELGLDEDKTARWKHILENLSEPVYDVLNGKEIVRATEHGQIHTGLTLQYMYPAGQLGSRSDKHLLDAMRNVFEMTAGWVNDNLFCSYYPVASRLFADPNVIMEHYREVFDKKTHPNMLFCFAGGGMENCAGVMAGVNEMLLQSYEGVIRIFANWNKKHDALYENLRADGAFLVSANLKNGVVSAEIFSEKGRNLCLEAPYGKKYRLTGLGVDATFDKEVTIETVPGGRYVLTEIN